MPEEKTQEKASGLEIAKIIITAVATVLVPIMIAFLTTTYKKSQTEQLQLKYMEVAIEILKEPPNAQTKELRKWAVYVLDSFSPISLGEEIKKELLLSPITPTPPPY